MKDYLKQIKADFLLSSVLCILLGVVFIIWKDGVIDVMGSVFAIVLIVIGLVYLCSFFLNLVTNGISVLMGIIILAVGIWFLIEPSVIVSLIPVVIGVVLLFHGLRALKETVEAKKFGYGSWGVNLGLALLSIAFGIVCIFNAFSIMEKAVMLVGVILIFNGLSNIWIAATATHAARDYARRNAAIDVEFVEDSKASE